MPKTNGKQKNEKESPVPNNSIKKKKKISREHSKRKRMSRLCYGKTSIGRSMSKSKDIAYSHYARMLETKGTLFSDAEVNEDGSEIFGSEPLENGKKKTCVVRFKKDAKTILQRLLITWLRRICLVCKTVCGLEGLSKIKERNVYTQIRLSYPPSEQRAVMASCQKALKSFINSKKTTSRLVTKKTSPNVDVPTQTETNY